MTTIHFICWGNNDEVYQLHLSEKGSFFNHEFENEKDLQELYGISNYAFEAVNLDLNEDFHSIFISDAEIQEVRIGNEQYYCGKYQNIKKLSNKWDYRHFTIPTKELNGKIIRVKLYNKTKFPYKISPRLVRHSEVKSGLIDLISKGKIGLFFTVFFLGAIFIFLIYTIGLTIQTRNPDFKFYAYYLAAILVHNSIQADAFLKVYALFPKNPIWYHHLNEFLQMFIYAFFMVFLKIFLELKTQNPKMNSFLNASTIATVGFGIVFLLTAIISKNFAFVQDYLSILWLVVVVLGVIIVVNVYKKLDSPIRYYILTGSIFLLVGSLLELYTSLNLSGGYNWNLYAIPESGWFPFNYTQLAILCETVCFALGIGYKIRIKEHLLIDFQTKEIDQLQAEKLQQDSEIKSLALSIASEKSMRKEATQLIEILETQYGIIEFQLNPHFLFNNLNAINNLIMHDQAKAASKYLINFSKLIRLTINRSKLSAINLEDEKIFINNYLNLEKQRLNGQFDFQIELDEKVIGKGIEIPPFILQPYLEYCLWNHLLPSKEKVKLELKFSLKINQVCISIKDKGVIPPENIKYRLEDISNAIRKRIELVYDGDHHFQDSINFSREADENIFSLKLPLQVNHDLTKAIKF